MLSHDEEEALAAMEARLRDESPDLHALFEDPGGLPWDGDPAPPPTDATAPVAEPEAVHPAAAHLEAEDPPPTDDPVRPSDLAWSPEPTAHRLLRLVTAVVAVVVATALATVVAGPEVGGLLGALAFPAVGLYGWSLYGCPGHRR